MPPRILKDIMVIDRSTLGKSMYPLLFTQQLRFRVRFAEEYMSLHKRSLRLRPDLLVINSNALPPGTALNFPCPTILLISPNRIDLKEALSDKDNVIVIQKPFYPYDLISLANRLITQPVKPTRGRKRGRPRHE